MSGWLIPCQSRLKKCELDGLRSIRNHVKGELTNDVTVFACTAQLFRKPSARRGIVAHRWCEQLSKRDSGIELSNVLKVSKHEIPTFLIRLKSVAYCWYSIPRLSEMIFG